MTTPAVNPALAKLAAALYSDIDSIPPRLTAMFYGDNGSGKTVLAYALADAITPPDKLILSLDISEGYLSLRNHPELRDKIKPRLSVMKMDDFELVGILIEAIRKRPEYQDIGCIIVDEISGIASTRIRKVTAARAKTQGSGKDPYEPKQPDYMIAGNQVLDKMLDLQEIGCHVIYLAHFRTDNNASGIPCKSPNLTPQVNAEVVRALHFLGYVETIEHEGKLVREVQCHGTNVVKAKTKVGGMNLKETPENTVKKIAEWVRGERPDAPVQEVKQTHSEDSALSGQEVE